MPNGSRMVKITPLTIQTISEKDVGAAITLLEKQGRIIKTEKCPLCNHKIGVVGAFMPKDEKVITVCDDLKCILQSCYLTMKHNGNGSPLLEI